MQVCPCTTKINNLWATIPLQIHKEKEDRAPPKNKKKRGLVGLSILVYHSVVKQDVGETTIKRGQQFSNTRTSFSCTVHSLQ